MTSAITNGVSFGQVRVLSDFTFCKLFDPVEPLAIDKYQRGFVWDSEKVEQMASDLHASCKTGQPYYMGSLLLHKDADSGNRYIVDGQQRLTALCILYWSLNGRKLPPGIEFNYRTKASAENIQHALACLRAVTRAWPDNLFSLICFTVIEVTTLDQAFSFFDTQNTRSVRLHATDLLKAFHLREIGEYTTGREQLLRDGAGRWEKMQHSKPVLGLSGDFAPTLFNVFLWRTRRWTGANVELASRDGLLHEFQKRARESPGRDGRIPLSYSRNNLLSDLLIPASSGNYELQTRPIALATAPAGLPFAIRQPVTKGIGFFLMADKYAALVHELVDVHHTDREIRAVAELYSEVVSRLSAYLREVFLVAALLYLDRFGSSRIFEFALRFEFILGGTRVAQSSIFWQTAKKIILRKGVNTLDVVVSAYDPKEVMEFLLGDETARGQYQEQDTKIPEGSNARSRYRAAVMAYYKKKGSAITGLPGKEEGMGQIIGAFNTNKNGIE